MCTVFGKTVFVLFAEKIRSGDLVTLHNCAFWSRKMSPGFWLVLCNVTVEIINVIPLF